LGPLADEQMVSMAADNQFQEQVLALLSSAARRASLGQANQVRASDHFSLAVMARAYERLYASLTNS
jgi:hypothetical protein